MRCDVAVVGAGPAGTTAARFLAKKGFDVILVEARKFPREKPCGGMLTPRVFERFRYLSKIELASPSYGSCLYPPSLTLRVPYFTDDPQVFMVLRSQFDHALLNMAENAGAELITDRVQDVEIKTETAQISLKEGKVINADIIVGADGVKSIIGEKTGLTPSTLDRDKTGLCAVCEVEIGENEVEEYFGDERPVHLFLGFDNLFGYAWVFPKSRHVNIGLGGLLSQTRDISGSFRRFVAMLQKENMLPPHFALDNYSAALIPIGGPNERTYRDRVVLCGDAAGFVNPLTGEGIYYAMASGEIASHIITRAIEEGRLNGQQLSEHQRAWMADFGKELKKAAEFQNIPLRTNHMLEIGAKLANTDPKLTEMLASLCLNRKALNKSSLIKILLRLPFSLAKNFYTKIIKK
ncbi:MAG: NAD(P)/FAD-dependent oxidoreductase [Thermoproteota archaeon]